MNVLYLPSIDGQTYSQILGYPDDWPEDRAIQEFEGVKHDIKTRYPEEWSWEEMEPELLARGFTSPIVCYGPLWDEG